MTSPDPTALSPRERECAKLVRDGLTDKQIALDLGISHRTVEIHVAKAKVKLQCRNRVRLAIVVDRWIRDQEDRARQIEGELVQ